MNNQNLSPEKLSQLLNIASNKLGTDPASLQKKLEQGDFNDLLNNMNPAMKNQLNRVISNPQAAETLLQNPNIQALMKKVLGK